MPCDHVPVDIDSCEYRCKHCYVSLEAHWLPVGELARLTALVAELKAALDSNREINKGALNAAIRIGEISRMELGWIAEALGMSRNELVTMCTPAKKKASA
jgi:hypothetical protein